MCKAFRGERWTQRQSDHKDVDEIACADKFGLAWKPGRHLPGLGRDCLHYGNNSGYQAINLAYLLGAQRIVLLGYDMHATDKRHFFGDHPNHLAVGSDYADWLQRFPQLAADLKSEGVEVINCTRSTALKGFPQSTMDEISAV